MDDGCLFNALQAMHPSVQVSAVTSRHTNVYKPTMISVYHVLFYLSYESTGDIFLTSCWMLNISIPRSCLKVHTALHSN